MENESNTKISVTNLNLYYGENHALKNVSMKIRNRAVTAFIGPSGNAELGASLS